MKNMNLDKFLYELSTNAPVPGGGGAAALAGALGIALGNMVGSLTVGKKKYAHVEDEITALNEQACALREELLDLVQKDAEVFEPLSRAYGIPKDDPEKDDIMEKALKAAAEIPFQIMKKCCRALELIKVYGEKGSVIAISDAGCGVAMCRAALESAALNVYINTRSMKDRVFAQFLNEQVDEMLDKYVKIAEEVYDAVQKRLH